MLAYAVHLIEELAASTWERIQFGEELDCSQSEETITDINLLELKRAKLPNFHIRKYNKAQESKAGIDWEWWIGSKSLGWWRYAIQAKKLSKPRHYHALNHMVGANRQVDILQKYASANQCIPLYCFYNYTEEDTKKYWHCTLPYESLQMGCTIAPMDVVKNILDNSLSKKFQSVHQDKSVLPWRCLLKCPQFAPALGAQHHPLASSGFQNVQTFSQLPSFLMDRNVGSVIQEFPVDFYRNDLIITWESDENVNTQSSRSRQRIRERRQEIVLPKQVVVFDIAA